ncbi:MAG: hypothetical protein GY711_24950 [bacterium]|nr:hypothetical protein [bacterium]
MISPSAQAATPRTSAESSFSALLGRLLDDPGRPRWIAPDAVTVHAVGRADGARFRTDESSSVLLLGDSFTNIYPLPAMGWGRDAGLAERLSLHLGRAVDCIARTGSGAHASRDALARAGATRLEHKRVVVFQFAARELVLGQWDGAPHIRPP